MGSLQSGEYPRYQKHKEKSSMQEASISPSWQVSYKDCRSEALKVLYEWWFCWPKYAKLCSFQIIQRAQYLTQEKNSEYWDKECTNLPKSQKCFPKVTREIEPKKIWKHVKGAMWRLASVTPIDSVPIKHLQRKSLCFKGILHLHNIMRLFCHYERGFLICQRELACCWIHGARWRSL